MPDQNNALETFLRNLRNEFHLTKGQMPIARKLALNFFDTMLVAKICQPQHDEV